MRYLPRIVCVLVLCVLVAGCFGSNTGPIRRPPPVPPSKSKSKLIVSVQWDAFHQFLPASISPAGSNTITHIGARIEYPNDSETPKVQSVMRQIGKNVGTITMEVPAAEAVNLCMAAVKHSTGSQESRALYYGVVHALSLPGGTIVELEMNDIDWVKATWHVSSEDEHIWNNDRVYEADASHDYLDKPAIYVRDPFQIGEYPRNYHDLLIGVEGRVSWRDNPDGWRLFVIRATNEGDGKPYQTIYKFCPYLKGDKFDLQFDLPQIYYRIEPTNNTYWVHWN